MAGGGFVASLDRPGGNVTGTSIVTGAELHAKRLEVLHELVPKAVTIAALIDPNVVEAETEIMTHDLEQAARVLGLQLLIVKAGSESEFDAAFPKIAQSGAGALRRSSASVYAVLASCRRARRRRNSARSRRRTQNSGRQQSKRQVSRPINDALSYRRKVWKPR